MDPDFCNKHTFQHNSRKPLGEIYSRAQTPHPVSNLNKPDGVWFEIDHSFSESGIRDNSGCYEYEVTINPEGVLFLNGRNKEEFMSFCYQFGRAYYPDKDKWHEELTPMERIGSPHEIKIDWARVAEKYKGMIISPPVNYGVEAEMWLDKNDKLHDPYGAIFDSLKLWDIDSGCIWDKDAIKSIALVKSPAPQAAESAEAEEPLKPLGHCRQGTACVP